MSETETNFYLTPINLVAQDEELVEMILQDVAYVGNLVNEATEFTGVTVHPLLLDTWDDRFMITYATEVEDSDEHDYERIRSVFEKAFEIGNLEFRFKMIEGGVEWHG